MSNVVSWIPKQNNRIVMYDHTHIFREPIWIWNKDHQFMEEIEIIETATCLRCGQVVVA